LERVWWIIRSFGIMRADKTWLKFVWVMTIVKHWTFQSIYFYISRLKDFVPCRYD
jgi:hypothetical protein